MVVLAVVPHSYDFGIDLSWCVFNSTLGLKINIYSPFLILLKLCMGWLRSACNPIMFCDKLNLNLKRRLGITFI
jgi:hypothetical protein